MAAGGPEASAPPDSLGHAGEVRQRAGPGVRRGLLAGVLASALGQVGALQGRVGRGGRTLTYSYIHTYTCTFTYALG